MAKGWTLLTIKELFEERLASLSAKHDADVELIVANAMHAADALVMQAAEYERRLADLNHEAARINAANAQNVSREVYDADRKGDVDWQRRIEGLAADAVTRGEFQIYKDSTSSTLTRQEGKREGIGGAGTTLIQVIQSVGIVVAILLGLLTFFAGPRALPVANPVTLAPAQLATPALAVQHQ